MRRWLGCVVAVAVLVGVAWLIAALDWHFGWRNAEKVRRGAAGVLLLFVGIWGVLRVVLLHPLFDPAYRQWLERTPWDYRKRLPKGPVHLVWEDAALTAVPMLLLWIIYPRISPLVAVWVFAAAYLLGVWIALWVTGPGPYAFAVGFGAGAVLVLLKHPAVAWSAMAGLLVVAHLGLRRSLAAFPWDMDRLRARLRDYEINSGRQRPPEESLGWPFDRIGPHRPDPRVGCPHAVLVSLLVGWLLYAIDFAIGPVQGQPAASLFAFLLSVSLGPVTRLATYVQRTRPPFNLWGRVARLRWLLCRYDLVFVAPVLAVATALLLPLLYVWGVSKEQALPACTALALLALLATGPRLRRWKLTAPMQLVPGGENRQRFVKL
jgi:hypothetical protein